MTNIAKVVGPRRCAQRIAGHLRSFYMVPQSPMAHSWHRVCLVCREDLDADFSVRERVRWGDPMAHLAHKKLAEAGPPPPVLPAHLHSKTGEAAGYFLFNLELNLVSPGGSCKPWPRSPDIDQCKGIGPCDEDQLAGTVFT
jgi:hypothetical protein